METGSSATVAKSIMEALNIGIILIYLGGHWTMVAIETDALASFICGYESP